MPTSLVNTSLRPRLIGMNGTLGARIVARRTRLGWNQTDLAARAGVTRAHLSQVESGKIALPTADFRRRLASFDPDAYTLSRSARTPANREDVPA